MKSKVNLLLLVAISVFTFSCNQSQTKTESADSKTAAGELDRTVLPIPEPKRQTYKELDARNAKAPERWEVKAPKGAPNVVVVMIDDMGFGVSSRFGGPVKMPVTLPAPGAKHLFVKELTIFTMSMDWILLHGMVKE